jgi:hypothetical protein
MLVKKIIDYLRYDIPYGIWNIVKWLPIIWKDRNWDYIYILIIMYKKLSLMEKHIRQNDNHVDAPKDADSIKLCVLLIDRLLKDNYYENVFKEYYKKWGRPQLLWENSNISNSKEYNRLSQNAIDLKEQDFDLLFKQIRKHIQRWWD